MKKVVVTSVFIIGSLFLLKKLLSSLNNNKSDDYNAEIVDFEPTESIIARSNSIGLPKYVAPKNKEIFNRDMYEPDRNRQGETLAGDSKNMCRQYGTCPPSLERDLGFW